MYVIIVLLLFLIFFAVYRHYIILCDARRNHKGYLEVEEAYQGVIKKHKLSISEVDRFGNRLIAIDRKLRQLVLITYENDVASEKCFNLDEILFCQIVKTANKLGGGIHKVSMELTLRNNGNVNFLFFDEILDYKRDLNKRLKKAQWWKRKIQFQLSTRPTGNLNHKGEFNFSNV